MILQSFGDVEYSRVVYTHDVDYSSESRGFKEFLPTGEKGKEERKEAREPAGWEVTDRAAETNL
jgi:hypothetical protein